MRVDAIVIVIAHRMSTVQDADNIIVLEGGCVVEQGKHDNLMGARGHYWSLHEGLELEGELESASHAVDTL
jgi:ATP-binding cassette subfamily B protein